MSLYVDASALLKHDVDEPDSDRFEQLFAISMLRCARKRRGSRR